MVQQENKSTGSIAGLRDTQAGAAQGPSYINMDAGSSICRLNQDFGINFGSCSFDYVAKPGCLNNDVK